MESMSKCDDIIYVTKRIYSILIGAEMPKAAYRPSLYPKGGRSLGVCAKDQVSTLFASSQPWKCEPDSVNFQSPHYISNDTSFLQNALRSDPKEHHHLKQEIADEMDDVITKIAGDEHPGEYH